MFNLNKESKITFVRGAFLGDFLVCLPFIYKIISDYQINYKNISFLIFNNSGINPIKIIFGEDHQFSKNTTIVNTQNIFSLTNKSKINEINKNSEIIYLPMWGDSFKGQILKFLFLKYNYGITKKIYGILKFDKKNNSTNSQYLIPFDLLGVQYDNTLSTINIFDLEENNDEKDGSLKISVYPNSKLKMKIWGKENYIVLLNKIIDIHNPTIYFIGGSEDKAYNDSIIIQLENSYKVINLAGKSSVADTLGCLRRTDLFIGNDGFPMHLAAIANIPIVAIFSYKNPLGCWDPIISDRIITIRTDVSCKLCYLSECENPVCVTQTKVKDVFDSVETILSTKNNIHEIKVIFPNKILNKDTISIS